MYRGFAWVGGLVALLSLALPACGDSDGDGRGGSAGMAGSGGAGTGGGSGTGGAAGQGGSGGAPLAGTDKVDLLLVVDNSISMNEKQEILKSSVPRLIQRLVAPRCVDSSGAFTGATYPCPEGSQPEFAPPADLHVGVITSSLGGHGGDVCGDQPPDNDHARLLPSVRAGLTNPNGLGFLEWKAGQDVGQLVGGVAAQLSAAGEQGCGFEAPLESWYRFLADPNPPATVSFSGSQTVPSGTDTTILEQRAAFLRPDSLLSIVLLSDENDCSIRDSDVGWYVSTVSAAGGAAFPLEKGTPICETNPNDVCCFSCAQTNVPSGCSKTGCGPHDFDSDRINLRCWEQKRRFGIDFMYPTQRYVNALTKPMLCPFNFDLSMDDCPEGQERPNPIFTGSGGAVRSPELVRFTAIVGVPWQALATDETKNDPQALEYMTADELAASGRWAWISGDSVNPPADPLMIESMQPRSGQSPSTGAPLAPPSSSPGAHPANGHEYNAQNVMIGDLQYACIFPLVTPRDCDTTAGGCNCQGVSGKVSAGSYDLNDPLCQDPASGQYSSVQHFGKAYPGLRHLAVLRDIGDQAVVASICPKSIDPASPVYGYSPALDALVESMAGVLLPAP